MMAKEKRGWVSTLMAILKIIMIEHKYSNKSKHIMLVDRIGQDKLGLSSAKLKEAKSFGWVMKIVKSPEQLVNKS